MTIDAQHSQARGRLGRRDFLRRAAALGLSASAVGAFLAACGGASPATTTAPSAAPSAAPSGAAASTGASAAPTSVLGGGAAATATTAPAASAAPAGGGTATRAATSAVATATRATTAVAATVPNVVTSKSGFKGTLQYWVLNYQPNGANQTGKLMDAATAAFTKANPDIKIETTGYTGDQAGFTKISQAVQGGGSVDIFRLPSDILPQLVRDNLIAPIDEFLTPEDKADIYPNMLTAVSVGGKAYSWPLWVPPVGMYINLDIFKERGVEPPKAGWTYDQFIAAAKQLTFTRANGDKVYGYSGVIDPGIVNTWPFIIGDGALPLSADNKQYTWNTPQAVSGLKKLVDLAQTGAHKVAPPDFGSQATADMLTSFQDRKVLAMYSEPSGASSGYRANKVNFDVVPMPIGASGKPITAGGIGLISVTAIKDRAKLTAAMDLGRYLTSAQVNVDVPGFYLAPGARKSVKVADPIDKFTPLVENCYITPIIAEWPQIRTILHPYIQNAVFGRTTPEAAFSEPAREINAILAARP
ncbi:MAG: ABC transporter, substrate-binding protein (cluster 1, maltose/g3p/polyamine/iron) [uncultured Thermomicrobiales bacterium]|uniref:ABC transporter, substrate-binding protein (Cluster 1, maltose/g3p/polyamine/iron) n=1 Tax=uncultured Thermomicrobiales bacterium TaxID=1645740 RepID=A0A6J4VT38_9BACT|nr:MAG: ABC transporter, substrate-binding protein (cluster 1, maltose/g3p/polyamine/iron) [uncultured Thermomicrobiales bacterium]